MPIWQARADSRLRGQPELVSGSLEAGWGEVRGPCRCPGDRATSTCRCRDRTHTEAGKGSAFAGRKRREQRFCSVRLFNSTVFLLEYGCDPVWQRNRPWGARPPGISNQPMSETELSVICKNCGSEVSPYVTECPYCGAGCASGAETGAPATRSRRSAEAPGGAPRLEAPGWPAAAQLTRSDTSAPMRR